MVVLCGDLVELSTLQQDRQREESVKEINENVIVISFIYINSVKFIHIVPPLQLEPFSREGKKKKTFLMIWFHLHNSASSAVTQTQTSLKPD